MLTDCDYNKYASTCYGRKSKYKLVGSAQTYSNAPMPSPYAVTTLNVYCSMFKNQVDKFL